MPGFEFCEELPRGPDPALLHILQALTDSFERVGLSCLRNSPERRRNVVRDWMSFVMSSIALLFFGLRLGALPKR
jgi:hypothetical protein